MWRGGTSPLATQPAANSGSSPAGQNEPASHVVSAKPKRNRQARPQEWARTVRKRQRNSGQPYVTPRGVVKPARNMNEAVRCRCPWKCRQKISREQRRQNYESFYSNASWDIQTTFIAKSVKTVPVKRRKCNVDPAASKKQHTREYYLQAGSFTVRVCKQMFMQTLAIDSARIHRALVKSETGNFADQRGRHTPSNKIADADLAIVRQHVASLPQVAGHRTQQQLNFSAVYRMYVDMMKVRCEQAESEGRPRPTVVGLATYKRVLRIFSAKSGLQMRKDNCGDCDEVAQYSPNEQHTRIETDCSMGPGVLNYRHDSLCKPPQSQKAGQVVIKDVKGIDGSASKEIPVDTDPAKRKRNRMANPKEWASAVRKQKRNAGEQYVTKRGVVRPARNMNEAVGCRCPWKCHQKLSRDQRQKNYDAFYSNASWSIQTTYLAKSVKTVPIKRRKCRDPSASKRQHTREFYLQADSDTVRVCKQMFMQTLVVDSARIHRALIKGATGNLADQRGRHVPSNKTADSDLEVVRHHIRSFPIGTSPEGTNQPSSDVNASVMYKAYRDMLTRRIEEAGSVGETKPVILSAATYKRILHTEFNIKFRVPPHKDKGKPGDRAKVRRRVQSSPPEINSTFAKETIGNFDAPLNSVDAVTSSKSSDAAGTDQGEYAVLGDWCYMD